jgi:hypothetical protein
MRPMPSRNKRFGPVAAMIVRYRRLPDGSRIIK